MAQVQEYLEPGELYTSSSLSRSRFLYDLGSSAALCPQAPMAHPLLQSPFRPGGHMPQSLPQTQMPNNLMHVHSPLWCQHPAPGAATDNMAWKGLPDQPMLTNTDLVYSDDASQSTLDKPMDFESSSFWIPTSTSNMVPSPGIGALLSPISPSNDVKHISSPIPDYSPVTPDRGPASYTMACGVSKVYSSPGFVPPTPQSVVRQQSGHTATPSTFSNPVTSVREPVVDNTIKQNDDMTMYGSEHSYEKSHSSSPGMVQWFPPGYLAGNAAPAQSFQHHQSSTARFDLRPNSFLTSFDRGSRQRQAQWSNTTVVPAQTHFQNRFMTPLSDGDKAQRSKDDETLLRMKKNGYTYRDIRKALGRKVAESTLRGRYRSLTKPRKDRLRAPKWTEIDIVLLKRYVEDEFDRLDVTQPSLNIKQKPDKVPWMKIVELIASNGGSYKFGAATAKKKWFEVARPAPTRSSRRRSQA